jgi:membrane protein
VALGFKARRNTGDDAAPDGAGSRGAGRGSGAEADRGRRADTPSDIPARGWKDILLRAYANIGRDRVITIAAGVTFYSILALFPAIAALVSLYGLFADPGAISSHLDSVAGVLPGGAVSIVGDELKRLTAQRNGTLGFATLIGLVTALWSANAGIKSLFDALNLVYNEPEKRGFIMLNAVSLAFTAATIAFVLLALGAMVVLPLALDYVGGGGDQIVRILRWPALLIAVALWLAALYRFGPSRTQPKWRWITWGGGVAAVLWLVVSLLFTWYAANFGSYNKTYGSLGAAVGFMVWIWLSIIVVLLGAEVDAEMEHQTARDTTEGAPKPMGQRGARMADTVGPATD